VSEIRLRVHDADPARAERIRARCVALLERRRREAEAHRSRVPAPRGWLEPAVAVGLCALYLAEAFARAVAVFR
jgi:hypothetical protein